MEIKDSILYIVFIIIDLFILYIIFFKKELVYKILGLQLFSKGDRFIFKGIGEFKIIGYFKNINSYDCYFYLFDKNNNQQEPYKTISEVELKTNLLIHKIDNKRSNTFGNSIDIKGDGNIVKIN